MYDTKQKNLENFKKRYNLDEKEALEARFNLLGFFGVLHKIDQRLKKEAKQKKND